MSNKDIEIEKIELHELFLMRDIDASNVDDLAQNLKASGEIFNPLLVRPGAEGNYQLISGHRRLKAAKLLGWKIVPCHVRELTDTEAFIAALSENIGRSDPTPMEEARAYKRARDDFSMSLDEIADKVGKDRSTISNRMRLLDLSVKVQKAINEGVVNPGQCEHGFLRLKHTQDQEKLLDLVHRQRGYGHQMTVKDVEERAKDINVERSKIERLADYLKDKKDKIKAEKCPTCGKPPNSTHWQFSLSKNIFHCGDYHCLPWNPLTGEKIKEERESTISSGPGTGREEMQTRTEARGHRSNYPVMAFFTEIAKRIKAGSLSEIKVEQLWSGKGETQISFRFKDSTLPSMTIEGKDYKNLPFKTFIQILPFENDEVVKHRELLWKLEGEMGKKDPAEIIRVPLNRLVINHKALSKGTELTVESKKYKGTWVVQSVHRDYSIIAVNPKEEKVLLEEKELRELLSAAGFRRSKKE